MKKYPGRSLIALSLSLILLLTLLPVRGSRAQTLPDGDGEPPPSRQLIFSTGSNHELRQARRLTRRYFREQRQVFGLDRNNNLQIRRSWVDELAMAHVRVQQTFADVPVFGGEAIVHWNPDGTLGQVTNSWINNLQVNTNPDLTAEVAAGLASATHGCSECQATPPKVQLWVQRHNDIDRLVYEVRLPKIQGARGPSLPVYFVDAHSGEIVWSYDNLQTATGPSLYNGEVSFNTFHQGDNYYLEDVTRKVGTYSYLNGTTTGYNITNRTDIWTNASALDGHYGMSMVLDYFKNVHRRNGLDGEGGPTVATAHDGVTHLFGGNVNYGTNYMNAFWDGNAVFFGDGDGSTFSPLVTLDIVGHEMTHAITESTARLIYSGEPGALNESMSDVFGAMVERSVKGESDNTWMMAEECFTPGTPGDALRHLGDPYQDGSPDFWHSHGEIDVHVWSGIPNYAFYLLAKGGTHRLGGSMTGIGADNAAKIWYKALTSYMTPSSNFFDARNATASAAAVLFGVGSAEQAAVHRAWCLVRVGPCEVTEPIPPTQLQNGVPVPNLSGTTGSQQRFYLTVPTGSSNLTFKTNGGSGDADLYIKFGSQPTLTSYDCRPYIAGNSETCNRPTPASGDWYVMINGYTAYSGLTLTGSYTPPDSRDLIANGGFEHGVAPWVLSGAAFYGSDPLADNGNGYIYLGQTDSATGIAYQQFTIPAINASANLSFYLNVISSETTTTAEHDQMFVEIRNSEGRLLQTLATYSNLDKGAAGSYRQKGPFNLMNYRGQTIRLQFRATTNGRLPTTFRIDDVSLR